MYEIQICPLKRLYRYAMDGDMRDVAVLAVSSYDIDREKLLVFGYRLCLNFADVTANTDPSAFSQDIAVRIANYIKNLPESVDTLFVCCDSGESRSTAMAASILRYNGRDDMTVWQNPHYHPNPLVYQLLCDALGVGVTDEEVKSKLRVNRQAFSRAIQG